MDIMEEFGWSTKFKIVEKIATGGMGAIYLAEQIGTCGFRKTVAIKTIHAALITDRESLDLFIGEAKLVADLIHENIVQVYQFEQANGMYYLIMEYANGKNLDHFMQRHVFMKKRVALEIAVFIISQVCCGLDYAHKKRNREGQRMKIVHRDVSPSNVIITYSGGVKLTDFGIAKALTMNTPNEREVVMGKYPYMAPEQVHFEGTDHRSDIFSLGLVFYELLTSKIVFDVKTWEELLVALKEPIVPPHVIYPSIPEEVSEITMKALAKEPDKRFNSTKEMGTQLEEYLYRAGCSMNNEKLAKYMELLFPEGKRNSCW